MKPLYIMMIGLPGSGKSNTVSQIIAAYPKIRWWRISTDEYIDREAEARGLTYNDVFQDCIDQATKIMNRRRTIAMDARERIIHDQTNLTITSRAKKLASIPRDYVTIGVFCDVDERTRQTRLTERPGKAIPEHVDRNMYRTMQRPTTDEFDYVRTQDNWSVTVGALLNE